MHMNFDHVFDMQEYPNIEIFHYIMYLYNVNHNYYKRVMNQVDKNLVHDQYEMDMKEYDQLRLNIMEDLFAM
jgi:hypothetical protein